MNPESRADDDPNPFPQDIEPIEDEEEKKKFNFTQEDKLKLSNWVHIQKGILKAGRHVHTDIEEDDDDKKKKLVVERLKEDPYFERLKPLSKDQYRGLPSCWIVRAHGDTKAVHRHLFKKDQATTDVVISLRSLVWPGMVFVAKDAATSSLYVGDGMKYEPQDAYFHKFPYLVMSEPKERAELPEPNGTEEERKDDKKDAN